MNTNRAVLDFAAISVVLAGDCRSGVPTLSSSRFIDYPDGLRVRMVTSDDFLSAIAQLLLIPLDRFEETL